MPQTTETLRHWLTYSSRTNMPASAMCQVLCARGAPTSITTQVSWPQVESFPAAHCLPKTRMGSQELPELFSKSFSVKNAVSRQPTPLTQSSGRGLMRDTVLAQTEWRPFMRTDMQPSRGSGGGRPNYILKEPCDSK